MINVHLGLPASAQKEDGVGVAMVCGPLWGVGLTEKCVPSIML